MPDRTSTIRHVAVHVLLEPMRLYRIVPERESSGFEDAFRSHYELDRPPRGPENRAAVIHMAVSMFDEFGVAEAMAQRIPKLGGRIATMDLEPDAGICVAKTGSPAHWSVWGRPPQLVACVAEVESISL